MERVTRQNSFEIDGFKTGLITLPGIEMDVHLEPTQYLRYDGPITSISAYLASLPDRLKEPLSPVFPDWGGFNQQYRLGRMRGFLMVVRKGPPMFTLCNEAHEAASIAVQFGMKGLLEHHFQARGFPVDLEPWSHHQVGLIAAFIVAKLHHRDILPPYKRHQPEALELLKETGLI